MKTKFGFLMFVWV